MKENIEQNEAFVALHEKMKAEGNDPQTTTGREAIIAACIEKFTLGGKNPRHTYRAWLARLADPTKYEGKYAKRIKKFQMSRTHKTTTPPPEPEPATEHQVDAVITDAPMEQTVEATTQA